MDGQDRQRSISHQADYFESFGGSRGEVYLSAGTRTSSLNSKKSNRSVLKRTKSLCLFHFLQKRHNNSTGNRGIIETDQASSLQSSKNSGGSFTTAHSTFSAINRTQSLALGSSVRVNLLRSDSCNQTDLIISENNYNITTPSMDFDRHNHAFDLETSGMSRTASESTYASAVDSGLSRTNTKSIHSNAQMDHLNYNDAASTGGAHSEASHGSSERPGELRSKSQDLGHNRDASASSIIYAEIFPDYKSRLQSVKQRRQNIDHSNLLGSELPPLGMKMV